MSTELKTAKQHNAQFMGESELKVREMSNGRFQNKVAIVTGASRGIGQAIAIAFAREGAKVVGVARGDLSETGAKVKEAGGGFVAANADLGKDRKSTRLNSSHLGI